MRSIHKSELESVYRRLFKKFGPQHWWPGETTLEIMVGAVLTQNTNWGNVEKAIQNLKRARVLTLKALAKISQEKLGQLIRPSGYFNVKAKRLKHLIDFVMQEYHGDLKKMKRESLAVLRQKLLEVKGIGPETADSILLYAFDKPIFVVDAYTKRFLSRHNFVTPVAQYHDVQKAFMDGLPHDVPKFNEYHALMVRLGKELCRPTPLCAVCPLKDFHYSLIYKCHRCHRALLEKRERLRDVSYPQCYVCRNCHRKT